MRELSDALEFSRVKEMTSFFVPGKEAIQACLLAAERYSFNQGMLEVDKPFYSHPADVLDELNAHPGLTNGYSWLDDLARMNGYEHFHDWRCKTQFNGGLNMPLARSIRSVLADLEFYQAILTSPWLQRNYR